MSDCRLSVFSCLEHFYLFFNLTIPYLDFMAQNTAPVMSGLSSPGKSSTKGSSQKSGNTNLSKRLQTELMQMMMDDSLSDAGISAFPDGDNLFRWIGTIQGPIESAYEGLELKLQMEFPDNYPFKPPTTIFKVHNLHDKNVKIG